MERYYNTLKNELIYLHHFHSDEELNRAVCDFAYFWYNHMRPHLYNEADNGEMYDTLRTTVGKYAYCSNCGKRLFKMSEMTE